jgi:hypothetical protein
MRLATARRTADESGCVTKVSLSRSGAVRHQRREKLAAVEQQLPQLVLGVVDGAVR